MYYFFKRKSFQKLCFRLYYVGHGLWRLISPPGKDLFFKLCIITWVTVVEMYRMTNGPGLLKLRARLRGRGGSRTTAKTRKFLGKLR